MCESESERMRKGEREGRGRNKLQDVAFAGVGLDVGGRVFLNGQVFAG